MIPSAFAIDVAAFDRNAVGAPHVDPVLPPRPAELYARRAARLRVLARGHESADHLGFAADVAEAMAAQVADGAALPSRDGRIDRLELARSGAWIPILDGLLSRLAGVAPPPAAAQRGSTPSRMARKRG
ncbi:formate dehydrogenase accessory protein FdhE [Xanthobacter sp. V4C-4]|uniref:formate dehydrogenase accessory protein FdhE domain-containing protein n=1 Tax=Xanthobacter cornucopiae TaxID=3119924 RepID=UPI00372923BB